MEQKQRTFSMWYSVLALESGDGSHPETSGIFAQESARPRRSVRRVV